MSSKKSAAVRSRSSMPANPGSLTAGCSEAGVSCETTIDRIVLEMRKFIAASIFFNTRAAESTGLGLTDMQMLHVLQIYGPLTPSRLAACTGLSSGGVTVALDRLQKAGFVRRDPNPSDRRSLLIALVPARLRKLNSVYQEIEQEIRTLLATIPEQDLQSVMKFFETMHAVESDRNSPTRR